MNLVRKLKINKITPIKFSQAEQDVITFIESKITNLIPFKEDNAQFKKIIKDYDYSIYYLSSEGECILDCVYVDNKIIMLVKDDNFWKSLFLTHCLTNTEIEFILKYFLEQEFKIKFDAITRWISKPNQQEAENLYKVYELSKKTKN